MVVVIVVLLAIVSERKCWLPNTCKAVVREVAVIDHFSDLVHWQRIYTLSVIYHVMSST